MDKIFEKDQFTVGFQYFYRHKNKINKKHLDNLTLTFNDIQTFYYNIDENFLIVPLYYGLKAFGKPEISIITKGDDLIANFKGNLFEHQEKMVDKILESNRGLIQLNTGEGKTVIALNIISKIKKNALIIVPNHVLLSQWQEETKLFLSDDVTISTDITKGANICITTVQNLTYQKYQKSINLIKPYGIIIYDEVHLYSSDQFIKAINTYGISKYTYGFSATIQSLNGKVEMLRHYFGNINDINDCNLFFNIKCKIIKYYGDKEFNAVQNFVKDKRINNPDWVYSITIRDTRRMDVLIDEIDYIFQRITTKYGILVFFEFKKECNDFKKYLESSPKWEYPNEIIGIVHGDVLSEEKLTYKKNSKLLIATVKSLGVGFSRKDIRAVIIASPSNGLSSNQKQKIGRCLRRNINENENKKTRFITYINDTNCAKNKFYQDNYDLLKTYDNNIKIIKKNY